MSALIFLLNPIMKKFSPLLSLIILILASGCSLKKLAMGPTVDLLNAANPAIDESDDLILTEEALPAMIMILEGLLKSDLANSELRFLLSKAYGSYAFAFIEDRFFASENSDPEKALPYKERAKRYYWQGRGHAINILQREIPCIDAALAQGVVELDLCLTEADPDSLPFLFWTAYNWGNFINLSKDNPDAIADLAKVERMMARVLVLDESYFNAAPHLFYGVYYASRPVLLGGDPEKAKKHFERAIDLTSEKYLVAHLFHAQFYAVAAQDQPLFERMLKKIQEASPDIYPAQRLANQLAKRKAMELAARTGELF
jgi:tetratricopeptide (TPR) repeat protein